MSETTTAVASDDFVAVVTPLMKEYSEKMNRIRQDLLGCRQSFCDAQRAKSGREMDFQRSMFEAHRTEFFAIESAAADLARHVSQRLEHTELEDTERLLLRARLAELEAAMQVTQQVLHAAYLPTA